MIFDLLVCVWAGEGAQPVAERCGGRSGEHLHEGGMSPAGSEGRARCASASP